MILGLLLIFLVSQVDLSMNLDSARLDQDEVKVFGIRELTSLYGELLNTELTENARSTTTRRLKRAAENVKNLAGSLKKSGLKESVSHHIQSIKEKLNTLTEMLKGRWADAMNTLKNSKVKVCQQFIKMFGKIQTVITKSKDDAVKAAADMAMKKTEYEMACKDEKGKMGIFSKTCLLSYKRNVDTLLVKHRANIRTKVSKMMDKLVMLAEKCPVIE